MYNRNLEKMRNRLALISDLIWTDESYKNFCLHGPGSPEDWNGHCQAAQDAKRALYKTLDAEYKAEVARLSSVAA
jgi:hypothetical protein